MSYLGEDIKKLGFGMMRLPRDAENNIIIEQVKPMVDAFMDAGFTYFDTAWSYGGSEDAVREALVKRYPRERFQLATKNAAWVECKSREDAIAQFETSLERTQVQYFDFYLLHNMGKERTKIFEEYDMWSFVKQKKAEGKIKNFGFSFHSDAKELDEILTAHPEADFVQLQINYADWENPDVQSRACYEVARKHGKPVIIMEPVKGGMLATPPESVEEIFKSADPNASCASWAIRFAASLDGVITVLSGMSTMEQVEDNISYMKEFRGLSEAEQDIIKKAQAALAAVPIIPCTSCNYCAKVCPQGIGISGSFTGMNIATLYGVAMGKKHLSWHVEGHNLKPANECVKCGKCEQVCPQQIPIRQELQKVTETLLEAAE